MIKVAINPNLFNTGVSTAVLFNMLRLSMENTQKQINSRRRLVDEREKQMQYEKESERIARQEVLHRMRAQAYARMGIDPFTANNPSLVAVHIAERARKADYGF